jgi:cytochrome c
MSSNLNTNKIAAAILLAGLIGMVAGKATEFLYDGGPKHAGGHHEEKRGYSIEVTEVEAGAGGAAAPAGAADISALYPTADVKAGGEFFAKKCAVCHTVEKGGANKVGPHLWGVVGRDVAHVSDFNYSKGMQSHADRKWSWDEMNHFLWSPKKWVPGTLMAFAGIPKDQERANVIAYLNSQSDSPLALPPVTVAKEEPADAAAEAAENPAANKPDAGAATGNTDAAKAGEKTPPATTDKH